MKPTPESEIDRIVICQAFLDALGGGTYLEVGIRFGGSFFPTRARTKWGVDPAYAFKRREHLKFRLNSALHGRSVRLFRLTSDDFFQRHGPLLQQGIDVALLDGLHTYEQTLRDVLNTLKYLKPGGAIVLHDCNPATELEGMPAESYQKVIQDRPEGWAGPWSGDVWKVIVHLRALRPELETLVLDCDHGVGVVRHGINAQPLALSAEQIEKMTYADLDLNRKEFLGLTPPARIWSLIESRPSEKPVP